MLPSVRLQGTERPCCVRFHRNSGVEPDASGVLLWLATLHHLLAETRQIRAQSVAHDCRLDTLYEIYG